MNAGDALPDDAMVVRGGRVPFQKSLRDGCGVHKETGHYGFSVQSAANRTVQDLASELRHREVGYTTAGEIRKLAYDVVQTPGRGFHATVVVPRTWSEEAAEQLANIFQAARSDSPRGRR